MPSATVGRVGVDVRDAVRVNGGGAARRSFAASVLLAALVALAAGLAGTTHFGGARWVPHLSGNPKLTAPARRPDGSSRKLARLAAPRGAAAFPVAPLLWGIGGIVVLGVAFLLWRWWSRRPSPAATDLHAPAVGAVRPAVAEPEPEPEVLLSGLELALVVLDEQREPADAVVRAWLGLEETAAASGIVRRPAETPTELTSRILGSVVADDRALRALLRLYLQARFGEHPVTGEEVAAVRVALSELVASWPTAKRAIGGH